MCPSISTVSDSGSSPTVSRPTSARLGLRPAATSSSSASSTCPPPTCTWNTPSCSTRSISTPARTSIPSSRRTVVITSAASGSSLAAIRSASSSRVTCAPYRRNTCASSSPLGPPPTTISRSGTSVTCMVSRLVQYGVASSPAIGGRSGSVPVLSSTPREARSTVVSPSFSTRTTPGPSSRPWPRTIRTPACSSGSTCCPSVQSWLASRIRAATSDQSGHTRDSPASRSARRTSAIGPRAGP